MSVWRHGSSWEEINHLLPHVTMRDCAEMMAQVRWIKTPGKVRLLQDAADRVYPRGMRARTGLTIPGKVRENEF